MTQTLGNALTLHFHCDYETIDSPKINSFLQYIRALVIEVKNNIIYIIIIINWAHNVEARVQALPPVILIY